MRNTHSRTWNMARKLKNMARNSEKGGKWEMHTIGHGIWRETLKTVGGEQSVGHARWGETLVNLEKGKRTL